MIRLLLVFFSCVLTINAYALSAARLESDATPAIEAASVIVGVAPSARVCADTPTSQPELDKRMAGRAAKQLLAAKWLFFGSVMGFIIGPLIFLAGFNISCTAPCFYPIFPIMFGAVLTVGGVVAAIIGIVFYFLYRRSRRLRA